MKAPDCAGVVHASQQKYPGYLVLSMQSFYVLPISAAYSGFLPHSRDDLPRVCL